MATELSAPSGDLFVGRNTFRTGRGRPVMVNSFFAKKIPLRSFIEVTACNLSDPHSLAVETTKTNRSGMKPFLTQLLPEEDVEYLFLFICPQKAEISLSVNSCQRSSPARAFPLLTDLTAPPLPAWFPVPHSQGMSMQSSVKVKVEHRLLGGNKF